jgi:hypothetical protein
MKNTFIIKIEKKIGPEFKDKVNKFNEKAKDII